MAKGKAAATKLVKGTDKGKKKVSEIERKFLEAQARKAEEATENKCKATTAKAEEIVEKVTEDTPLNIIIPHGASTHNTMNGAVALFNTDLVSQKLVDIILYVLNDPQGTFIPLVKDTRQGHGLNMIDFRNDGVVGLIKDKEIIPTHWYYWAVARVAGCNLKKCVSDAFHRALDPNGNRNIKHINIKHAVWQNILFGFLHELHHGQTAIDSLMQLMTDKEFNAKEEKDADNFGRQALYELAKQVDIEPDLGNVIEDMIERAWVELDLDNSKEEHVVRFVKCQEYMKRTGDAWCALTETMDKDHHIFPTFREFLHFASGEDVEDKDWTNPVPSATDANPVKQWDERNPAAKTMYTEVPEVYEDEVYVEDEGEYTDAYGAQQTANQHVENMSNPPGFQGVQNGGYGGYQGNPDAIADNAPGYGGYPAAENTQSGGYQTGGYQPQTPAQGQVNPNVTVGAGTYEKLNMDPNAMQATINSLYRKMYLRIFNDCQFDGTNPNTPTFLAPNRIKETIPLTPEENMLVKDMDCIMQVGNNEQLKLDVPVNNWISGRFIDQACELPGFVLALTNQNGDRLLRKFLPQNPRKMKKGTSEFSGTAVMAQKGHRIAWVLDPNDKSGNFDKRLINGVLEFRENGRWVTKQVLLDPRECTTPFEGDYVNRALSNAG